ncbi:MAG: hypothetical protein H6667_24455 [Ardenticatenaceae bacterium]|nr:hypothetical protein [Ardenticatenaceae bacterium]MCB9444948.1 hypothetical protein [Ardenticatenaceae bacterium]
MMKPILEPCPDCGALLPPSNGAGHRYVGASAACWELFAALNNAGEPPLAPGVYNGLLTDAYMVQHPGVPSPQAIQSVAVHLLVLYGVLEREMDPGQALWIRLQAVDERHGPKHGRFHWLTPPSFTNSLTVADIVKKPTPGERTAVLQQYVTSIWSLWANNHLDTVAAWYERFVG